MSDAERTADGGGSTDGKGRSPFREHYRENGDRDPRGNGDGGGGHHHGKEMDVKCPMCGKQCGNSLRQHLPCNGRSKDTGTEQEEPDR